MNNIISKYDREFSNLKFDENKKVFMTVITKTQKQFERLTVLADQLDTLTAQKFSINSLSAAKYLESLDFVLKAILENDRHIRVIISNFNNRRYIELQKFNDDTELSNGEIRQLTNFENQIEETEKLINDNDELLSQLESLLLELLKKTYNENSSIEAKNKINELIEQLKFYV